MAVVKTSGKISRAGHLSLKGLLALPRGAFLLLVGWNAWGLAEIIYNAYTYSDTSLLEKWKNAWYNVGGDWGSLASKISKGYNRKPFGLKLAPKEIKEVYSSFNKPVSGHPSLGIGAAGGFVATVTSALTIIELLLPLLKLCFEIAGKSGALPEEEEDVDWSQFDNEVSDDIFSFANSNTSSSDSGGYKMPDGIPSSGDSKLASELLTAGALKDSDLGAYKTSTYNQKFMQQASAGKNLLGLLLIMGTIMALVSGDTVKPER